MFKEIARKEWREGRRDPADGGFSLNLVLLPHTGSPQVHASSTSPWVVEVLLPDISILIAFFKTNLPLCSIIAGLDPTHDKLRVLSTQSTNQK